MLLLPEKVSQKNIDADEVSAWKDSSAKNKKRHHLFDTNPCDFIHS